MQVLNFSRPSAATGTWREVYGDYADEYFHAWSIASFIGQVAAAGKAEYPLPLYVNAALRDPLTHPQINPAFTQAIIAITPLAGASFERMAQA